VASVVAASGSGVTKHYLTVFMAFARGGSTAVLTRLPAALDGTPRFALTYTLGTGPVVWQPWTGVSESDAPLAGRILVNGDPVLVEEPPDDVIG